MSPAFPAMSGCLLCRDTFALHQRCPYKAGTTVVTDTTISLGVMSSTMVTLMFLSLAHVSAVNVTITLTFVTRQLESAWIVRTIRREPTASNASIGCIETLQLNIVSVRIT